MLAYVEALKDKMALPDLTTVLNTGLPPPTVSARTTVKEAAKLMKDRRTTAVCVMETVGTGSMGGSAVSGASGMNGPQKIAGIFTSKDVVLRVSDKPRDPVRIYAKLWECSLVQVIAAGLDASRCSVVRVMTPHPDTAPPTMSVQDALKKMHGKLTIRLAVEPLLTSIIRAIVGHYLNLPVVEADGRLIGIVDVLKLTYKTLEQVRVAIRLLERSSDISPTLPPSLFLDRFHVGEPRRRTDVGQILRRPRCWRRRRRHRVPPLRISVTRTRSCHTNQA